MDSILWKVSSLSKSCAHSQMAQTERAGDQLVRNWMSHLRQLPEIHFDGMFNQDDPADSSSLCVDSQTLDTTLDMLAHPSQSG